MNMTFEHVHIIWSHGLGLLALNSLGYCSVTNCKISYNGRTKGTRIGGNVRFAYQLTKMQQNLAETVLTVSHSEISYGLSNSSTDMHLSSTSAGGMIIVMWNLPVLYRLNVSILSCTFHHNEAEDGANLMFDLCGFPHLTLNVIDSTFVNDEAMRYGLRLLYTCDVFSKQLSGMKLLISNSTFLGNKGGGFYSEGGVYSLEILNSHFGDSSGKGAQISLHSFNDKVTIVICNSTFTKNRAFHVPPDFDGGGGLDIHLQSGCFGRIILDVMH